MKQQSRNVSLLFLIILSLCQSGYTQASRREYQPLKVGDKVPDYTLKNLINYPTKNAKLTDFEGKLLIFDLWSTYCATCIESWPKLLELQKEFGDKIQIILLNSTQDEVIVRNTFEKRKRVANIDVSLPTICGDTILGNQLFRHKGVPHVVWIDEEGFVKSITYGTSLTSKNINALLRKEPVFMHQKTDLKIKTDTRKPLFIDGNGGNGEQLLWQSVLSKYVEGILCSYSMNTNDKDGYGIYIAQPVATMYRYAYSNRLDMFGNQLTPITLSRTILNVKDPSKYSEVTDVESRFSNYYVYQLTSGRSATRQELQNMMQHDLKRYFGLNVEWQKRKMKCFILTARDSSLIQYTKGNYICNISDVEVELNKLTVAQMIKSMESSTKYYHSPYPIIDETGYKGLLGGMKISANIYDPHSFNSALQKYKMSFKLEDRIIDVLVISEAGSRSNTNTEF